MTVRVGIVGVCACSILLAQGTEAKSRAEEYPVHAVSRDLKIGAEFTIHSFGIKQMYVAEDYLTIEVALFPPPRGVMVDAGRFSLRVNGKKPAMVPQSPGMVASSIKYPNWSQTRQVEATAGIGNTGVVLGRPVPVERFPGDPTAQPRLPRPPQAPKPDDHTSADKPEPVSIDEVVQQSALPEGHKNHPVSGYLFFNWQGKIAKIRSLELIYSGEDGDVLLKLK